MELYRIEAPVKIGIELKREFGCALTASKRHEERSFLRLEPCEANELKAQYPDITIKLDS